MNPTNARGWMRSACRVMLLALLTGCGGGGASTQTTPVTTPPAASGESLSVAATAGQALFADITLSASGRQSCATCHVPSRAFTADPVTDHGLPVPLGGVNMDQTGFRNAPSLAYASFTPLFSISAGPTGGFFRDGRASSLAMQAQQPFITPFEMANHDAAEVVERLQQSAVSLQKFIAAYGEGVLADPDTALQDMGLCGPFAPATFDVNARPIFSATTSLCGLFKVPTLRNIAITAPYFHKRSARRLRRQSEYRRSSLYAADLWRGTGADSDVG